MPPPPLAYSYQTVSYNQVAVARGDVELWKDVTLAYVPVKQEVLSFQVGGVLIKSIDVSLGDAVKQGQILAELERDDIQAQIAQTQHQLDMLNLSMAQLKELIPLEKQLDTTGSAMKAANDASRQRQIDDLQSQIDVAQLSLDALRVQSGRRVITAGIDGVVTSVQTFKDGDYSQQGAPMVTVADKSMSVFKATGDNAQYFTAGTELTVNVDGKDCDAAVVSAESIGAAGQSGDGQAAYIQLNDPTVTVTASYATAHVSIDKRTDVLYLPVGVVKVSGGQSFVYMMDSDGVKIAKNVTTGLVGNNYQEITGGLNEGDVVIAG
ncbi:MAG: biotin/lipoyl-binding protein [Defluviitaleaceae bacterium]|nr:biotin/lipoyl-binding protein [Defluviitaleaceae bacterium]